MQVLQVGSQEAWGRGWGGLPALGRCFWATLHLPSLTRMPVRGVGPPEEPGATLFSDS